MSFWEKIKQSLRSLMAGRHGIDPLSIVLVWVGLALYLLAPVWNLAAQEGGVWFFNPIQCFRG